MGIRIENKFLFAEPPLLISPTLATRIGLNRAIVVQQLHYWLTRSVHLRDGRRWTYETLSEWGRQFPFWSERTIRRVLEDLEIEGFILKACLSEDLRDRTLWYSLDYDRLASVTEEPLSSGEDPAVPAGQSGHLQVAKTSHASGQLDHLSCGQVDKNCDKVSTCSKGVLDLPETSSKKEVYTASGTDTAHTAGHFVTKRKRRLHGTLLQWFEEFWQVFAYKRGKAEAADAWLDLPWSRALHRDSPTITDDELYAHIATAAGREAAGRQRLVDAGRTPKFAQGWLSGRRFDDELSSAADLPAVKAAWRSLDVLQERQRREEAHTYDEKLVEN